MRTQGKDAMNDTMDELEPAPTKPRMHSRVAGGKTMPRAGHLSRRDWQRLAQVTVAFAAPAEKGVVSDMVPIILSPRRRGCERHSLLLSRVAATRPGCRHSVQTSRVRQRTDIP